MKNEPDVVIDFCSGQHGHFLEYVMSKYIYNIDMTDDLFDEMGTCDGFAEDPNYQQVIRRVHSTHATVRKRPVSPTLPIIFIKHCSQLKYDYIWMVNFFFKVNFVRDGYRDQTEHRTEELVARHKENWYGKLEHKQFHEEIGLYKECALPNVKFDFRFEAFFSLQEFLIELQRVAEFLNRQLTINDSLITLWHEFINKNQGYTHYTTASTLLDGIVNGESIV